MKDRIQTIAEELGYPELNELQKLVFESPETYPDETGNTRNLMIIGPTSSGKTLIPKLLYYDAVLEALEKGMPTPKMLFVVPYRALAAQKVSELRDDFNRAYHEKYVLQCEQSTSEYRQADDKIKNAGDDIDIAVVINEKAFVFASADQSFLQRYQFIVFDEIGLIKDENRGIKLDFLMTWIRFLQNDPSLEAPRMLALGTPFYDWTGYAENFDFFRVELEKGARPRLIERPVYVPNGRGNKNIIAEFTDPEEDSFQMVRLLRENSVMPTETTCLALEDPEARCPQLESCRQIYSTELCPRTGKPCCFRYRQIPVGTRYKYAIIAELCRKHLQQHHQILIFWNDRFLVRELCGYLYQELAPLLDQVPETLQDCKEKVLDACTDVVRRGAVSEDSVDAFTEDELVGIFEDVNYQAYCAGVGFHSSALPPETRAAVEDDFLGRDSRLRIVCSTETLAYGINSAVDVVIVAEMNKNTPDGVEFLKPIEYQNYAGRAGRLKPGKKLSEIVGYVYPILDTFGPHHNSYDPYDKVYTAWRKLKEDSEKPERITSSFYSGEGKDYIPFMLLCLIPAATERPISAARLGELLKFLPKPEGEDDRDLSEMLRYLQANGLIKQQRMMLGGPSYTTTDRGAELKGYTPSRSDYDLLLRAMKFAWDPKTSRMDNACLIYALLGAKCLKNHRLALHLDRTTTEDELLKERFSKENMQTELIKCGCYSKMEHLLECEEKMMKDENCLRKIIITAAILTWADTANPRVLSERFLISYPLLQALTRELSYLLDISAQSLSELENLPQEEWGEQKQALHALERSIIYGFPPEYYTRLLNFFSRYADPELTPYASPSVRKEACRIVEELNALQPVRARQIRKVVLDCTVLHEAARRNEAEHEPYGGSSPARTLSALQRFNKTYTALWRSCVRSILKELSLQEHCEEEFA